MSDKHISLLELSERTGLPAAWLKREADARRIPCLLVGRRRMFCVAAVLKTLEARQKKGGARG